MQLCEASSAEGYTASSVTANTNYHGNTHPGSGLTCTCCHGNPPQKPQQSSMIEGHVNEDTTRKSGHSATLAERCTSVDLSGFII